MKKTFAFIAAAAAAALFCQGQASAEIRLPGVIGNGMVLQQNATANVWGFAEPESEIRVTTDWNGETCIVRCASDGSWRAGIATPSAGMTARSITITEISAEKKGGKVISSVTLSDILIGEVWLCSGQSNMEMPLDGFWDCPVEGSAEEIALSGSCDGVRMITIPKTGALAPQESVGGEWKKCSPENTAGFSATGYHFAKTLSAVLGIPVGIISCSWGGSTLEGWLPKETVASFGDLDTDVSEPAEGNHGWNWDAHTPFIMYNGMLHPLRHYTLRGFCWYQGESNVGRHDTYADRLETMVSLWRDIWNAGELPFLIVEIAPYEYGGDGTSAARLREAQFKAARAIHQCGIVCTNDLVYPYESTQIHPCRKTEVGQRLAYAAINRTYGIQSIDCEGPAFREMKIEGDEALLYFDNDRNGFSPWNGIEGFEMAGADKVFHKAEARVLPGRKCVAVRSSEVPHPVAVRYCFRDFCPGNLTGARNLPAFPFRTDSW